MKATGIIVPACILIAASLAVCLIFERQACLKLNAQNDALRRQLAKMAKLTADNQRLSNLLAQAKASHLHPDGTAGGNVARDERLEELARLRSEVDALRQQSNEVENLRADTLATHAELKAALQAQRANRMAGGHDSGDASGGSLQILQAQYGTDSTNLDVSAALNDRIRGGSLKTVAGNGLMGDPDFGQVKNLTIVYSFGGVVTTQQFREGDIVILPPPPP
jgi:hypothetical protein